MSANPRPTLAPGIRPYDLMPSQLQCDFSTFSETELETENKREVLMLQNQLVSHHPTHIFTPTSLMGNRNSKKRKLTTSRYVFCPSLSTSSSNLMSTSTYRGKQEIARWCRHRNVGRWKKSSLVDHSFVPVIVFFEVKF